MGGGGGYIPFILALSLCHHCMEIIIPYKGGKKKGRPLNSMTRLLIGCMEIIFLKLTNTIFGLD